MHIILATGEKLLEDMNALKQTPREMNPHIMGMNLFD